MMKYHKRSNRLTDLDLKKLATRTSLRCVDRSYSIKEALRAAHVCKTGVPSLSSRGSPFVSDHCAHCVFDHHMRRIGRKAAH